MVENEEEYHRQHGTRTLSSSKGLVEHFLSLTLDGFNTTATNKRYEVHRPAGSKLDVLTITSNEGTDSDINDTSGSSTATEIIGLCNLVTISGFTFPLDPDGPERAFEIQSGLHHAFSTYLAIKHLNSADGSIVSELSGLNERCNIHFVPEFLDTGFFLEASRAYDVVRDVLERDESLSDTCPTREETATATTTTTTEGRQEFPEVLPACSFLGSYFSETSGLTSILTGHDGTFEYCFVGTLIYCCFTVNALTRYLRPGYTQVSGSSAADFLDDRNFYPRFSRTVPAQIGAAKALVEFLVEDPSFMEQPYLAVLLTDDDISNAYLSRIRQVVTEYYNENSSQTMHVRAVRLPQNFNSEDLERQIRTLKDLRFQTVFAILGRQWWGDFIAIIEEAYRQKIIGHGDTVWYFEDDAIGPILNSWSWTNSEVLFNSFRGSGMIWPGNAEGNLKYDMFASQLQELQNSEADMEFLKTAIPRTAGINETELDLTLTWDGFLDVTFLVRQGLTNHDRTKSASNQYH